AGIDVTCNTQINRSTIIETPELYEVLREAGVIAWQLQLTVPMGRAAEQPELLLQPYDLPVVFTVLERIARRAEGDGMRVPLANTLGYHGPHERLLRPPDPDTAWQGCQAGLTSLGIEADGTVKGCPSLPTAAYSGGNVRHRRIAEIVTTAPELTFNLGDP